MSQKTQQTIHVVATSHGTDNLHGQQLIHDLRADLERMSAQQFTGQLLWHEAYVDVQEPGLESVIAALPEGEPAATRSRAWVAAAARGHASRSAPGR